MARAHVPLSISVVLFGAVAIGHQGIKTTVDIVVPPSVAAVSCSRDGVREFARSKGRSIRLSCDSGVDTLRCDGEGMEPIDVPMVDVCARRQLFFTPATAVDLRGSGPISIQWLELNESVVRVLSEREFRSQQSFGFFVADSPSRFVRFRRENDSPFTVAAVDLVRAGTLEMPPREVGGELFLLTSPAVVSAAFLRLEGPTTREIQRARQETISLRGLRVGTYQLQEVYESGLASDAVPIHIDHGASVFLRVPPARIGAVSIVAPSESCRLGSVLNLMLGGRDGSGMFYSSVAQSQDMSSCQWYIDGLKPGTYYAVLKGSAGVLGSESFVTKAQQIVNVQLAPRTVTVSATVTRGTRSVSEARLQLASLSGADYAGGLTGNDGSLVLELPHPGGYLMTLTYGGIFQTRSIALKEGNNVITWNIIDGASIEATVEGAALDETLQVHLRGVGSLSHFSVKTPGAGNRTVKWDALEFGQFELSARQGFLVSDTARVTLTPQQQLQTVVLTIEPNNINVFVRSQEGQPIENVSFNLPSARTTTLAPGHYALQGISPGSVVRLSASGFAPSCRVAGRNQDIHTTLLRGRPAVLVVPTWVTAEDVAAAEVSGVEGSDCSIPLTGFGLTPRTGDPSQGVEFDVRSIPRLANGTMTTRGRAFRLLVTDDGRIHAR